MKSSLIQFFMIEPHYKLVSSLFANCNLVSLCHLLMTQHSLLKYLPNKWLATKTCSVFSRWHLLTSTFQPRALAISSSVHQKEGHRTFVWLRKAPNICCVSLSSLCNFLSEAVFANINTDQRNTNYRHISLNRQGRCITLSSCWTELSV